MTTKTDICNQALGEIGGPVITDFDSDTAREAQLCRTFYDSSAKITMMMGAWTSTINRATLSEISTSPIFEFSNQYQLPINPKSLRVLTINEEPAGIYRYKIEEDKLLIDLNAVKIKYIGFVTEPGKYGPALEQAIIARLAALLSYPLSGDLNLSQFMWNKFQLVMSDAVALDGMQGSAEEMISNTLLQVR